MSGDSELTTGAIFLQLAVLVYKQLDIETEEERPGRCG